MPTYFSPMPREETGKDAHEQGDHRPKEAERPSVPPDELRGLSGITKLSMIDIIDDRRNLQARFPSAQVERS